MKTGSKWGDDCRFRVVPRSQVDLHAASIPAAPALLEPLRYKHGSSHWRYPAVAHSDPSLSAGGGAECGGEGGHSGLKCGFQDGGGLWRMAMTAAFVLGSASFGITGSE